MTIAAILALPRAKAFAEGLLIPVACRSNQRVPLGQEKRVASLDPFAVVGSNGRMRVGVDRDTTLEVRISGCHGRSSNIRREPSP